jgi:hypothetical protein
MLEVLLDIRDELCGTKKSGGDTPLPEKCKKTSKKTG